MNKKISGYLLLIGATITLLGAGCANAVPVNTPEQARTTEQTNNNAPKTTTKADQPVVKANLKLTYPNGGEVFNPGQKVKIKWTSAGVKTVYISMVNGGKEFGQIAVNGVNAALKEFLWTVPVVVADLETGYKIFIRSASNDIRDSSDGTFGIKTAPLAVKPFLKLTAPTGGEQFKVGQKVTISWTSSGVNKVYLSLVNGGKEFGQIAPDGVSASLGKFDWTVPNMTDWGVDTETGYKIFINNNDSMIELRDSSAATFSIFK